MTRASRQMRRAPILRSGWIGYDPRAVTEDPDPPTDRAAEARVYIPASLFVGEELLEGETVTAGGSGPSPSDPAHANDRDFETSSIIPAGAEVGLVTSWWAVDFGADVEVTAMRVWDPIGSDSWPFDAGATLEWSDDGATWTEVTKSYATATVPTGLAFPLAETTTEHRYQLTTPASHRHWRLRTAEYTGFHSGTGLGEWFIDGLGATSYVWTAAPLANDGSDASWELVTEEAITAAGSIIAYVDLLDTYLLGSVAALIGFEGSGARTVTIEGANAADFSDAVTLAIVAVTATGSLTADDVVDSLPALNVYRYIIFSTGTAEDVRVYEIHLRDPSAAQSVGVVTDHGGLSGLSSDDHTQYVLTTEGGRDTQQDHGAAGSTENVDPTSANVHYIELDADCTITLQPPAVTRPGRVSTVEVYVEGDGSHTPAFAASGGVIVWPGGSMPAFDTTGGVVTRYIFETLDDGATWFGNVVGGGGSSLTVEDEGTPLATAAATLDFVGAGVTASGTGAEKTIAIPGGATASDTGVWRPLLDPATGAIITDATTGEAIMGFGPA